MKKAVLLFSSGLDSYLANTILSNRKDIELHRIYFDCCKYSRNEIEFFNKRYNVGSTMFSEVMLSPLLNQLYKIETPDAYIPNRNLMFVTVASSLYPDADEIYINSMKDDRAPDSGRFLFEDYAPILSDSIGHKVEIKSLFWNKEKVDAIYDYLSQGGSGFDLLMHTYSCFHREYHNIHRPIYSCVNTITGKKYNYLGLFLIGGCLNCAACFRRMCALTAANIFVPFENIKLADDYKDKIDKKLYPRRYESIKNYLEFLNDAKITI